MSQSNARKKLLHGKQYRDSKRKTAAEIGGKTRLANLSDAKPSNGQTVVRKGKKRAHRSYAGETRYFYKSGDITGSQTVIPEKTRDDTVIANTNKPDWIDLAHGDDTIYIPEYTVIDSGRFGMTKSQKAAYKAAQTPKASKTSNKPVKRQNSQKMAAKTQILGMSTQVSIDAINAASKIKLEVHENE